MSKFELDQNFEAKTTVTIRSYDSCEKNRLKKNNKQNKTLFFIETLRSVVNDIRTKKTKTKKVNVQWFLINLLENGQQPKNTYPSFFNVQLIF